MAKKISAIVTLLNKLLVIELTASDVYWQQYSTLKDLRYRRLAKHRKGDAKEERGHAQRLIDRILQLDGDVQFERATVDPGMDVAAILRVGLKLEIQAREVYTPALAEVMAAGDHVTRDILAENQLANEEGVHWHEQQLRLIEQMSLANFLQAQL